MYVCSDFTLKNTVYFFSPYYVKANILDSLDLIYDPIFLSFDQLNLNLSV